MSSSIAIQRNAETRKRWGVEMRGSGSPRSLSEAVEAARRDGRREPALIAGWILQRPSMGPIWLLETVDAEERLTAKVRALLAKEAREELLDDS